MTIRTKVVGMLTILFLIAALQALFISGLRRGINVARAVADRRAEVRDLSLDLELALARVKAATESRPGAAVAWGKDYEESLAALRGLTRDPEQLKRLEGIDRHGRAGRLGLVQYEIDALRARQDLLYTSAREAARRVADRATLIMLVMAVLTMALTAVAALSLGRLVLKPLAALSNAVAKVRDGNYPEIPGTARRDEIGVLSSAFATMTETVQAREAELSQSLSHSLTITETVPAALMLVDTAGRIRSQNQASAALIGTLPSQEPFPLPQERFALVGRDGTAVTDGTSPIARALDGESAAGDDLTMRTADGRLTPMVVSAAPLRHASGRILGAVVAFQDVSALKAVDRMKDEFVSIVSHELRTPLTSIRGSLQLVLDGDGAARDEEHTHLITVALNNCERLIRIINDILDISKIEAGKTNLAVRPTLARDLIHAAIDSVADVARTAQVAFAVQLPDDLPPVLADPDRMIQVVVNLLSNAVKFAPPNSRVTVEASHDGSLMQFVVADHGPGIAAQDLPKLFHKFQQVDSTSSRSKGGTGLGLAIVKGLVEQHGGTIRVDSEVGRGTTFIFTVPVARGAAVAAPRASATSIARRPNAAVVLVVDDDDDFRHVMGRHLERAGFRVIDAADGASALEAVRRTRVDVITLDLLMPGMDGWTLLQHLSDDAELSRIPVVVITSMADRPGDLAREVTVRAKTLGSQDLVREITAMLPQTESTRVLIVEDDDDLRALLAHTLRKQGFQAFEARDGREALAQIERQPVAVVILDLKMPNVDGIQVLTTLQQNPSTADVPVLVISGSGDNEFRVMNLGASRYLSKPLDVGEVGRLVHALTAHV